MSPGKIRAPKNNKENAIIAVDRFSTVLIFQLYIITYFTGNGDCIP